MFNLFTHNKSRIFNKYKNTIRQINDLSDQMESWSDYELKLQTQRFKKRFTAGENLDEILPEAFATVKAACKKVLGISLFDVQLLGGIILHQGNIAEMKTGEGKTLTAILPAYLNTLSGNAVHIVTVNDYLAKRDSEWVGTIYQGLGVTVGLIQQDISHTSRKENYQKDIIYVTNSELGFDYLRDNMSIDKEDLVQTGFHFCVIDEVDSILIDEARTPLILSGPSQISTNKYELSNNVCQKLQQNIHYEIDEKARNIALTDLGITYCERQLNLSNLYDIQNPWAQYILNALKAKELFTKDRHYLVRNNEVIIVDEFTGRVMPGRRWSDGLHQAIEAKENVVIQKENQTLASITYQNFFLLYDKLSGMTGTALTEAQEFKKIYQINVIEIPTNKPCLREDFPDLVYKREYDKWVAIANECYDMYSIGRPTLVGTTNVEKSELLAKMLDTYQIPYNLLNAKPENVEREAEIIAQAGQLKALTIATNMAGRGTDIILGGNAKQLSKFIVIQTIIHGLKSFEKFNQLDNLSSNNKEIYDILNNMCEQIEDNLQNKNDLILWIEEAINPKSNLTSSNTAIRHAYTNICSIYEESFRVNKDKVLNLGGLHVIGTERHESRRIDNQLRGRSGRQGDNGSSRFFLSLEDNLLRIFGGERIVGLMNTLQIEDNIPIESKVLSSSLNNAQKKVESYYYDIRKQLFEYDEVLNSQRQAIYAERNRILYSDYIRDCILEYAESTIDEMIRYYLNNEGKQEQRPIGITNKLKTILNLPEEIINSSLVNMEIGNMKPFLQEQFRITYDLREAYLEQLRPGLIRQLEKYYLLQQIDKAWQEHLEKMTNLRESIGWRSYGQQDPLSEYKNEAFALFLNMITSIRETVIYLVVRSRLVIDSNHKQK
uniref:Protein translocase subunit SecA n=1 Tax=Acrochaetium secundatum TaxID=209631 RepID=A0A4D6BNI1_9FLOR|nr:preprotein-translocase subunit a [Acrochaetium secundatum]QBX88513.1 preprotein-translocase subunit a [Acrochaetium secundatum]